MGSTGLLLVFVAGVIMVVVNELVKDKCGVPKVIYRYLPRDLDTYIRQEPLATVAFSDLFAGERPSKWPLLSSPAS